MLTWSKVLGLCIKKKGKRAKWALKTLTGVSISHQYIKMPIYNNCPKITSTWIQVCHASDCVKICVLNYVPVFMISQAWITIFKLAFIDYGTKDYWKGEISADGWEMKKSWKIKRLTAEISCPLQELGEGVKMMGQEIFFAPFVKMLLQVRLMPTIFSGYPSNWLTHIFTVEYSYWHTKIQHSEPAWIVLIYRSDNATASDIPGDISLLPGVYVCTVRPLINTK